MASWQSVTTCDGRPAWHLTSVVALCLAGCAVGPDYRRPDVAVPDHFKEAVDWRRAMPSPALGSDWWSAYRDDDLTRLMQQALRANQSIAQAEAAYRAAQASVRASVAARYPTVSASLNASRTGLGAGAILAPPGSNALLFGSGIFNIVALAASVSWEADLWGGVRRNIEAAKANAQATDAQVAGVRLSIAANVASDYFALRQVDADIQVLKQQIDIDRRIVQMTQQSLAQGMASNDEVLVARNTLDAATAALQNAEVAREDEEHALAVLSGVPPAAFSLPPRSAYTFVTPSIPASLPSQLLERRYDVVSAERSAAAANARIGVAKAAFFPTLNLTAQGGYQSTRFANLISVPDRFWTLGPQMGETLFDGGAHSAAVASARANYDEAVAAYRGTVLAAFQSVEDSLSAMRHLGELVASYSDVANGNAKLLRSVRAQSEAGSASVQDVLSTQRAALVAEQNANDAQAALCVSSVALIKNLGGGWQGQAATESAPHPSTRSPS